MGLCREPFGPAQLGSRDRPTILPADSFTTEYERRGKSSHQRERPVAPNAETTSELAIESASERDETPCRFAWSGLARGSAAATNTAR